MYVDYDCVHNRDVIENFIGYDSILRSRKSENIYKSIKNQTALQF